MKLLCPTCRKPLTLTDTEAYCENGHHFDRARQGYFNLYPTQTTNHGDEKAMVNARSEFLEKGYYGFLQDAVNKLVEIAAPQTLIDCGCGEGTYTEEFPCLEKIGFDISKDAIKHAAAKDPSTQYVVASVFDLPIEDESVDCAVSIFAPLAVQELKRVIKPGGYLLHVFPAAVHLIELKQVLYDLPYLNGGQPLLPFSIREQHEVGQTHTLNQEDLQALFQMTPYVHHTSDEGKERLKQVASLSVTMQFVTRLYRKD